MEMKDFIFRLDMVGYFLEVVISELLFLHVYKRKAGFAERFTMGLLISLVLISLIDINEISLPFIKFTWLLLVIAVSVVLMLFCYSGDSFSVISSCVAGVATQHIANKFIRLISLIPFFSVHYGDSLTAQALTEIVVTVLIYGIIYLMFARERVPGKANLQINTLSFFIVVTCIGLNRLVADHEVMDIYYEIAACVYAILSCFFALAMQFYLYKWQQEKTEKMVINGLLSASEKQYEQWKAMVEFTNVKMHDLKHMLNRIENLSAKDPMSIPDLSTIRDTINHFSPLVKTGNEVVDVLLRNMESICRQNDVRLNCVSFTDRLGALDSMSLYFLFANAIDNARDGAMTAENPEKRLVDVSLRQFGDSVIIHIWNYYEGEIDFENEIPISKNPEEGHGFGLKSIRMMVDRFDGVMKAYTEGDVFHLNIILPL